MKFIIVQLSPKRFVIAEGDRGEYKVCTKKLTRDEAHQAIKELRKLDTRNYSDMTKRILLEEWT